MMKPRHTTLCASAAIAAALMLTPSAGLAQANPVPVITVPDIAPPPAPVAAPPPVMTSSPVVQPVPEPDPVVEETTDPAPVATTRTTVRQPAAQTARVAAPAAPVAAAPDLAPADTSDPAPSADVASIADPLPVVAPVAEAAPVPTASDGWGDVLLPAILGGLVVIALAIWGFVAIGRRKPVDRRAAAKIAATPAPKPRAPVVTEAVVAEPVIAEPVAVEPQRPVEPEAPRQSVQPLFAPRAAATGGGLAHAGASVALPRELPSSYEDREALFRRMVDARPDRANPFTDRKARMKRARLIMQSIGRDFGDSQPWIDLSQYPNNWPELSRRTAAA